MKNIASFLLLMSVGCASVSSIRTGSQDAELLSIKEPMRERWHTIYDAIHLEGDPNETYEELYQIYTEPHRAYHTLMHIKKGLDIIDQLHPRDQKPSDALLLAWWLHCTVYHPDKGDNADRSAAKAVKFMEKMGVDKPIFEAYVQNLILVTETGRAPEEDHDMAFIASLEASIFAGSVHDLQDNELLIDAEQTWVLDRVGRRMYLRYRIDWYESVLDREKIFPHALFGKFERMARNNLRRRIADLTPIAAPKMKSELTNIPETK